MLPIRGLIGTCVLRTATIKMVKVLCTHLLAFQCGRCTRALRMDIFTWYCMYECMYLCVYVRTYVCIYVCTYVCIYVCMTLSLCLYVCMCVYTCAAGNGTHVHVCFNTSIYKCVCGVLMSCVYVQSFYKRGL